MFNRFYLELNQDNMKICKSFEFSDIIWQNSGPKPFLWQMMQLLNRAKKTVWQNQDEWNNYLFLGIALLNWRKARFWGIAQHTTHCIPAIDTQINLLWKRSWMTSKLKNCHWCLKVILCIFMFWLATVKLLFHGACFNWRHMSRDNILYSTVGVSKWIE